MNATDNQPETSVTYNGKAYHVPVDKGVPIPPHINLPTVKGWPFDVMEVGDSFLVRNQHQRNTAQVQMSKYAAKHVGKRFIARTTPDGLRIWRTA